MAPDSNRTKDLIEKFLKNQATNEELEEFLLHIRMHPDDPVLHKFLDEYSVIDQPLDRKLPSELSSSLKAKVRQKIFFKKAPAFTQTFKSHKIYWRIAAVFVPIAIFLSLFSLRRAALPEVLIETSFGEVRTVTLPDRSVITLNANSSIVYAQTWDDDKPREVRLHGEAYFNIVHKQNHSKFLVHTSNDVTIEVLGTQFNVNDRRNVTRVIVQSGKIKLDRDGKLENEIFMQPGDYAEITHSGDVIRKAVEARQYTSWKNRKLIFKDTPVSEIISILEDNYGYRSEVNDSTVLNETFTATYPADDITILLNALTKSFKISVDHAEHKISIGE